MLIRRHELPEHIGTIIKTKVNERTSRTGDVLSVGKGQLFLTSSGEPVVVPMAVRVGDVVHFGAYSDTTINLLNDDNEVEEFFIMKETDIFGFTSSGD